LADDPNRCSLDVHDQIGEEPDHDAVRDSSPDAPSAVGSLRARGMSSARDLAVREALGVGIRFGGALLLARQLGPSAYGAYATTLAWTALLTSVVQLSVEIQLIRVSAEPTRRDYDRAFTLVLMTSGLGTAAALAVVGAGWLMNGGALWGPVALMLLSVPVNAVWAPAQAILERRIGFRGLAALELAGDVVLYVVGLTLILLGFGLWGAALGVVAWQLVLLVGSYRLAAYRPRVDWDRRTARELIMTGLRLSPALWLQLAQEFLSLLTVRLVLGPAAAGQAALAIRLIAAVNVIVRAAHRLSLTVLARAQLTRAKLYEAAAEGQTLQLFASGVLLVGVTLCGPLFVSLTFGTAWQPTADVLAVVALSALVLAGSTVPRNLLVVQRQELAASLVMIPALVVFVVGSVALQSAFGLAGWGIALILYAATLTGLLLRYAPDLRPGPTVVWILCIAPPLFFTRLEWPLRLVVLVPFAVMLLTKFGRRQITSLRLSLVSLASPTRARTT
jgi:PST family polysaccharide transporter